jgi:hypothetical protein
MTSRWLTCLTATTLAVTLAATKAAAQSTQPPPEQTAAQAPPSKPNVDRIREAVNQPPKLIVDQGRLRIYVEVIAKWPNFMDTIKGYDLMKGATPGGNPMSHAEFLNMVTPRDMYSSAGVNPTTLLQSALVNYFGQKLIKKGIKEISEAKTDREISEIRARIDRELAALRGGK